MSQSTSTPVILTIERMCECSGTTLTPEQLAFWKNRLAELPAEAIHEALYRVCVEVRGPVSLVDVLERATPKGGTYDHRS